MVRTPILIQAAQGLFTASPGPTGGAYITKESLQSAIREQGETVRDEEAEEMIRVAGSKDGKVSREDWMACMLRR